MSFTRRTSGLARLYALAQSTGILDHDLISRAFVRTYFLYKRYVEDPFAGLVAQYPALFQNGHILDVGANVGYTATVFERAANPSYCVFAFEPDARTARMLDATVHRYGAVDRILPVHAAVGERDGWAELWHNRAHAADHRVVTPTFSTGVRTPADVSRVPIISLDQFLADRGALSPISFIKIDVQGYELPVCQGMTRTLAMNPQAVVAVEYSPSSASALGFEPHALEDFFRERHHTIYAIAADGTLRPFDQRQRDTLENGGYVDLLCSRQPL
jgi:FkbM family methyltransferase